ncbi:hypothetical protein H310_02022 [Aphanomyces invadans]|uniref:EF-hand domain-containing protein n=1 Tax=Aphanomyces invadans TaxID=157072 RepID=A0A024UM46_9STRA|nr:hypothetical protein H310_02022 [Aphanomyces invadans]ETW07521.1 hypothetical protein H310_02022 [Aphanomyces invadans]|eukprot:XP_008863614.1 hypothetical protein H310_02022 [Aphanomyces invadans]
MSKSSSASSTVVSSVIQVRRYLIGLNLSYTASVTVDHRYRHIVHAVLGKPRPDTPCPLAVVHVKFTLKDDMREILSFEIENDRHVYRLRDNIEFDERLLDRVIARKVALKRSGLIDLSDEYTRSRVKEPRYDIVEPNPDAIDADAVKVQLLDLFKAYDRNGDGSISVVEFRNAIRSGLIQEDHVELLFTQADLDRNGCINYEEFAKAAVDILSRMPSGYKFKAQFNELYDDYLDYFHTECATTMSILNQAFEAADYLPPNASGRTKADCLSYDMFRKCLASPLANLSREEINLAISLVPMNDEGKLPYANFDRILAKVMFYIAQGQSLALAVDIESYLLDTFEAAEKAWDPTTVTPKGLLPRSVLFECMHTLKKLMLSRGQVVLLIGYAKDSESQVSSSDDGDGGSPMALINYISYATTAAGMIRQFINPRNVAKRMQLCKNDVNTVAAIFHGVSEVGLERILMEAFETEDRDCNGVLDMDEFQAAMRHTSLGLTDEEIASLLAVADTNGDGYVDIDEFSYFAVHHLVQLKRQNLLRLTEDNNDDEDGDGGKDNGA